MTTHYNAIAAFVAAFGAIGLTGVGALKDAAHPPRLQTVNLGVVSNMDATAYIETSGSRITRTVILSFAGQALYKGLDDGSGKWQVISVCDGPLPRGECRNYDADLYMGPDLRLAFDDARYALNQAIRLEKREPVVRNSEV